MKQMKVQFSPDPCKYGCVWATFSPESLEWWGLFQTVTKRWKDPKTKEAKFEIDWQAVEVTFRAYGIGDEKRGIDTLFRIIRMLAMNAADLTDEQIVGWEEVR